MKAYCINIDSDTESWELSKAEFEKIGMEVERFSAIVEDNRPLAFNKSVHGALSLMPEGGWLFEDDVIFTGKEQDIRIAVSQLPSDANSLHLGCNIIGMDTTEWRMPEYYNINLSKLFNAWQSHATWYSKDCVAYILSHLRTDVLDNENNIFDDWFRRNVLSDGNSYVARPMLAYQRPRKSAIWGGEIIQDYTSCHKRGNEYLFSL